MPARYLTHSLFLLLAVTGAYLFLVTPSFVPYTLQLVSTLILIYASSHWLRKNKKTGLRRNTIPLDLTLLTIIILFLVVETGALASPLIFLLYFLLFAVALLFEIEATLLLTGTLLIFFLVFPGTNLSDLAHLGELIALVMVTPLAIFAAHQYEVVLEEQRKAAELASHITKEETDTLMFLSTNLNRTLLSALDRLSLVIPQSRPLVRTNLELLYQDLKSLYRSAHELKQTIDQETD